MLRFEPDLGLHVGVYGSILASLPPTQFYLRGAINVPYGTNPFPFVATTTTWDRPLQVYVNGERQFSALAISAGTVRRSKKWPNGFYLQVTVPLRLQEGKNTVAAECGTEQVVHEVVATRPLTMLWAFAQNIMEQLYLPLNAEWVASLSPWSSHFVEALLNYAPLMPDERVARTHGFRKTTFGSMVRPLTLSGITSFVAGLTYSNPIIVPVTENSFGTLTLNLNRRALLDAGSDIHVWVPNRGLATWLAFARLVLNLRHVFVVDKVAPGEVAVREPGRGPRWPGELPPPAEIPDDPFTPAAGQLIVQQHVFNQDHLGPDLNGLLRDIPRIDFSVQPTLATNRNAGFYRWTYKLDQKVRIPVGVRRLRGAMKCDGTHLIPRHDGVDYLGPFLPAHIIRPRVPLTWTVTPLGVVADASLGKPPAGPGFRGFPLTSRRFAARYQTERTTPLPTYHAAPLNTMSGYFRRLPPPDVTTFPVTPVLNQQVHLVVAQPGFPVDYYQFNGTTWLPFTPTHVWTVEFIAELASYGLTPANLNRLDHVARFADLLALPPPVLADLRKVEYDGCDYWWNGSSWRRVRYEFHPQLGGAQLRDLVEVRMDHTALIPPCEPTTFGTATHGTETYGGICVALFSTYHSTTAGSGSSYGG